MRGPTNSLGDVAGVLVGHHQRADSGWLTGTTVVLCPPGTVGGVDVRGGGPATRETDALAPTALVAAVHAVCLSGGSAFGLAAASGVADWLADRGVGLPVGPGAVVPIVPAACLFDLGAGGDWRHRPDASWGVLAAEAAAAGAGRPGTPAGAVHGNVGAGTGASAGPLKGGVGQASTVLDGDITVAALVACNPAGSAVDLATGLPWATGRGEPGEWALSAPPAAEVAAGAELARRPRAEPPRANTVLAVVATDAALTKPECTRLAMAAHDGMARAVSPAHGMTDGDTAVALATGTRALPGGAPGPPLGGDPRPVVLTPLLAAAADSVARAIVHAVLAAHGVAGLPAYRDVYPGALR